MNREINQIPAQDAPATGLSGTTVTLLPAHKYLSRYVIEHPIGAGGMGEVYRARDMRLERTVAIKMLPREPAGDSASRRRFLNAARAASALNHPNIVAIHDICTDNNVDFLVMEYVDGMTVRDVIAKGVLGFDQITALGSQVALALGPRTTPSASPPSPSLLSHRPSPTANRPQLSFQLTE